MHKAEGFWGGRHRLYAVAKITRMRAYRYAFRDRRARKRDFRRLWITRLTAACRARGITYSQFIHGLDMAKVAVDRKSMSELAIHDPAAFAALGAAARVARAAPAPAA